MLTGSQSEASGLFCSSLTEREFRALHIKGPLFAGERGDTETLQTQERNCFVLCMCVCVFAVVCCNNNKKKGGGGLVWNGRDMTLLSLAVSQTFIQLFNFIIIQVFKLNFASTSAGNKFPPGMNTDRQIQFSHPC